MKLITTVNYRPQLFFNLNVPFLCCYESPRGVSNWFVISECYYYGCTSIKWLCGWLRWVKVIENRCWGYQSHSLVKTLLFAFCNSCLIGALSVARSCKNFPRYLINPGKALSSFRFCGAGIFATALTFLGSRLRPSLMKSYPTYETSSFLTLHLLRFYSRLYALALSMTSLSLKACSLMVLPQTKETSTIE